MKLHPFFRLSTLAILTSFTLVACSQSYTAPNTSSLNSNSAFALVSGVTLPKTQDLTFHEVNPNIYWVSGGVGNVGVIIGEKGVIVIDTTISPNHAQQLISGIASLTSKPITTVILTHEDGDHVNGLSAFSDSIEVIVQRNAKQRLQNTASFMQANANFSPEVIVDQQASIVRQGVRLNLLHFGPAHTSGDLIVFLPDQRVVFTGDIFTLNQPRTLIHYNKGGSATGWVKTANEILKLDADTFVVGHGDAQTKAGLAERVNLVSQERDQIISMIQQNKSLIQIQTALNDAALTGEKPRFAPFSEVVYREQTEQRTSP